MNEELDFELVEDGDDQTTTNTEKSEATSTSDDESEQGMEQDTSSVKSNKSNFKKLNKLNKALIAENKRLKALAEKTKSNDGVEIEDDDDGDDESFDKTEFRFFLIENPEAKEFSREIEQTINTYPNLSFEDALALAKAKQPKRSVSSDDFSTRSVNTKVKKRLGDLTEAEAIKLDNSKYLEWARLKGVIK